MGGAAHFRIVIIASLAGILFGFDTAVIAGVTSALREIFSLSPTGLGAAVSSALWGTLLGALIVGGPGDRYGSRNMLRVVGVLYVISALGCALAWNFTPFVVSIPRRNRHRWIFGARTNISRGNHTRVRIFCGHDGAAIHRGFFLDAGNARRGTGTNARAASHGRARSFAPQ